MHSAERTTPCRIIGRRSSSECAALCRNIGRRDSSVARFFPRLFSGTHSCAIVFAPVPSREHETLRLLFQNRPELAPALLREAGVRQLSGQDQIMLYSDLILAALSDAARKAFEMTPEGYKYQSPLIRDSIEKGLVQGRAEGREEGRTEGMARSILAVLEARSIPVSAELRTRIMACSDLGQLSQWLRRAVTAVSADELITQ
ncbi:MAG TPA: hypothetical protein VKP30_18485 [Polyangiaceae bacterium]|nr:hypothetical protein [Polyangiaceae bacterium]